MRLLLLVLLAGCGRIAFDPLTPPVDAAGDAADAPTDTPTVVRACHPDTRYVSKAGLTNTYREVAAQASWAQARLDCMADEADLWVVDDATELGAFNGDWTGITDTVTENVWRKLDGSITTFLPFLAGEPDGGGADDCIRTENSGFEDRECSDPRDYVCECPAD